MASSPRTGRSSVATTAVVIGVLATVAIVAIALVAGFDPLGVGGSFVNGLFPPLAVTDRGERIRELYGFVFAISAFLFFLVEGLILWSVLRYRRKPGDDSLPPQIHGNAIAEVVWTVVPTIVVAFIFIFSWQTLNVVDAVSAQPQTKIRAVAGQFQWQFEYLPADYDPAANPQPEPVYTQLAPTGEDGGLVVPAGRTVQLYLYSPDVIHAFYVPQFLFKRDVVPGRLNTFEFTVNEADAGGTFRGQCAELCGAGHRVMLFDVHALSGADYDAWLEAAIAEADASPPPAPSGEPGASGPPPAAGPTVQVSALNVAFEQAALEAPADTPFKIEFDNKDASIQHNVAIHQGSPTGAEVFKGEIFAGPETRTYDVPALAAGAYAFVCTVHPNMSGTLTVN
ncbi:MAG: cytochrome c oxidase subunit II [Candidatus Limnocylindrales bacterium]